MLITSSITIYNYCSNYIERARVLFNSQVVSGVLPTDFNNWQVSILAMFD